MKTYKIIEICQYKDIEFEVELDFYYDSHINEYYSSGELLNNNLKKIRNEYRRIKGLLTDDEIKEIRSLYNLSQRDFSLALGFGEITITRYESKSVQDKAQDNIIRECKEPLFLKKHLLANKDKFISICGNKRYNELIILLDNLIKNINFQINQFSLVDRGNTNFDISKLCSVISCIKENKKNLTKTSLAKLLWYIDCLSYKLTNTSMTGLVYISMPYGAYPKMYEEILENENINVKESWFNDYECFYIDIVKTNVKLEDNEINIINFITKKLGKFNTKELVEYMHEEKAYIETKRFSVIPYSYSEYIRLFDDYK